MSESGFTARALRFAVTHPLLVLGLVCVLQVVPTLAARDYWAFDEVRHADALRHLLEEGDWFSLHLNGAPYPDKPPVYFWLAAGAASLLGTDGPPAFFLISGLGGFLFLAATWALGRTTVLRDEPGPALLAPLLVSVTPLFQLLLRTTRMDLLFGAAIVASTILLWRGIGPTGSRGATIGGLALAGLATLIKGPAGLALPLAATTGYLLWTGRGRRLLGWDVLLGLFAALALLVGWALGIGLTEGWDYLRSLLDGQVVGRAAGDHKHAQPFFHYLLLLPVACLPWTFFLAGVPWSALLRRETWRRLWTGRREGGGPRVWLAWCFLGGLLLLSAASTKLFIYLMPLLAPLAVLAVKPLVALRPPARTRAWTGVGIYLLGMGLLVILLEPLLVRILELEALDLRGTWLTAIAFALSGVLVLAARAMSPARPLTLTLGGLLIAFLLASGLVAPSLDPIMSPREQAEKIAAYVDRGYRPLVYRVYPGTYSYYARRTLPETRDAAVLEAHLATDGPILVVMARKYWERHEGWFEAFTRVHEQHVEGRPYILGVRDARRDEEAE